MERILLNKCKEQLIIMTQTKKERGKNTVKKQVGWLGMNNIMLACHAAS